MIYAVRSLKFLLLGAVVGVSFSSQGGCEEIQKQINAVQVNSKDVYVEASSPFEGVFSLKFSFGKKVENRKSIFIDSSSTPSDWQESKSDGKVGVRSKFGELLIDEKNGSWSLKDGSGTRILVEGSFARLETSETGTKQVDLTISEPKDPKARIYGSGNEDPKKRQLLKVEGDSKLGNGVTSIPYYWTTAGYGIFGVSSNDDSPAKWEKDAGTGKIIWSFPGESAEIYLMPAQNLYEGTGSYTLLTGRAPVPPKWSFGYLQSRWGWTDKAYIDDALKNFRDKKLPVDTFILDFECYTATPDYNLPPEGGVDYSDFNWNPALLPNAAQNFADYRKQGLRIVAIRKPRIGNQETLKMMKEKNWIMPSGSNNEKVALMNNRDLDFRIPELRTWYAEQQTPMFKDGVAGWWNDEGESSYTKYYYWNLAQVEMLKTVNPDFRHWGLNRSFAPGVQRLGGTAWTGDIASSWAALEQTPASLLNWGLAGMSFGGCDIGGYKTPKDAEGNRNPDIGPELMTRWMQAGVFFPIMRAHSALRMKPRFPWLYGPDAEAAIRSALELRYRLIPFYYSLAHESHNTGAPMMRPLVMEFPNDAKVENLADQWLMGTGLMAAPLLKEGGNRKVYFPDDMYAFNGTKTFKAGEEIQITAAKLDEIPFYVRKGTILPLGPVVQNTSQLPGGSLEIQVYPGKDATFTFVEDDGVSNGYLRGDLRKTHFTWNEANQTLSWTREGAYSGKDVFTQLEVKLFSAAGIKKTKVDLAAEGSLKIE